MTDATKSSKQNIQDRFNERNQAQRYRDRFKKGRRRATHMRESNALEKTLQSLPDGNLKNISMDVACGPGRFADILAKNSLKLIQTDYSPHMLALSKEDHPLAEKDGGYFLADAQHLSLKNNSVDLIFCHRFLNHVPNPKDRDAILQEFARVTSQYVVFSCLGPPRFVRMLRRFYEKIKNKKSLDGHINMEDLIQNATNANLKLISKTPIRSGFLSAYFLVFHKES